MENKKYYLKAPEDIGGDYFVEASDGIVEYTTLVDISRVDNYRGKFTSTDIERLVDEHPILSSFKSIEVIPPKEKFYTAVIDDSSLHTDDLFSEYMYVVHNRNEDTWSIVPEAAINTGGWSYILTEKELSYIKDRYTLFYDTLYVEEVYK